MRLAKYLAHAGVASRRAAEALIAAGRVSVGGSGRHRSRRATSQGTSPVAVDGRRLLGPEPRVVFAVHKPVGVVSTARDTHGRRTVLELVPGQGLRLYPVGRLDADSSGLILLTNDGELANRLTHPRFEVPKTYRARLGGGQDRGPGAGATAGGRGAGGRRHRSRARARRVGEDQIELTIHEGRNRQVRRMCEAVGHPVLELRRVGFGPLRLGRLQPGAHRRLSAEEVERLRALRL